MPSSETELYAPTPRQPRLIWNRRDHRKIAASLPVQTLEVIHPFYAEANTALDLSFTETPQSRLIWTNDNLVALTSLLEGDDTHESLEGKVNLIYIDPPFAVQSDFKINVEVADGVSDEKLPTLIEEIAYKDTWKDGLDSYLSMMRDRLELLKRLLGPTGCIYVHCDWHAGHYLKVLLDEVFGYENFQREIIWSFGTVSGYKAIANNWIRSHDTIFFYAMTPSLPHFEKQYLPHKPEYIARFEKVDKDKRKYRDDRPGGRVQYLDESPGRLVSDVWDDVMSFQQASTSSEYMKYPTQKPISLIQRMLAASTKPGDLVLDCFCGSGTTAVAAETMKDKDGKPAPRRWIAIDCGKFAVHITRKRLIEVSARPFTVENIGFYARHGEWKDIWQGNPSARRYRDAMVEVYGGSVVEGYVHLHGKKGNRWIHIGPLNAPVGDAQVEDVVKEAATTDTKAVDILTADIPIDWSVSGFEERYSVKVTTKIIPQAAIDAIRQRLSRRTSKDPLIEPAAEVHFFSPPDIEVRVERGKVSATVKLTRLTVDLDDCLSTQDAAKRAQIKEKITDWRALIDYWAVDWDYNGHYFKNDWQSFRTRRQKDIAMQAAHDYPDGKGEKVIAIKVTDIFGNDGLKVVRVSLEGK